MLFRSLESKSSALPTWLHPMAHLRGFEPLAHGLEVRCSIQLSYRCIIGAGEGNRTLATSLEGWGSTTELHPHTLFVSISYNFNQYILMKLNHQKFEYTNLKLYQFVYNITPEKQIIRNSLYEYITTKKLLQEIFGGGEWIRTTESEANGFTVRPLWPTRELLHENVELARGLEPPTY